MFAKKSLGQNFLKSESALDAIVEAGQLQPGNFVLEIGPGQGALTEKILKSGAKVLTIEKDHELIELLQKKFNKQIKTGQLTIEEGDILEYNEEQLKEKYKLIANIPYYITGAIIRKFLSSTNQPSLAVLLVQKEVAQRIMAQSKKINPSGKPKNKESLLSISVKAYAEPKIIKIVKAGSFSPAPKVDSAIVLFKNIKKPAFNEEIFFEMLHAGFSHKRKVLKKNLETFTDKYDIDKGQISMALKRINKPETVRSEELSLNDWGCLINYFFN